MKVLLRLLPYIREHAWAFWGGLLGLAFARFFEAMIPWFIKMGVDNLTNARIGLDANQIDFDAALSMLVYPAIGIVVCVLSQMTVTIISRILVRRIGMYAAYDLRNRIYSHLQLQGPVFFSHFSIGDLMARAINDISLVRQVIAGTSRMTIVLIFTATTGLVFMFMLSWKLALAVLIPMPFITIVAYYFSKQIYAQSHKVQEGFSGLSTFVQENLNGIRTVQAIAQEDEEINRFSGVNEEFADDNLALFTTSSLLGAIMPVLAAAATIIIIGYGSHLVNTGDITLGTFAAFFSYLALLLWPVREAGSLVTQWQRGASGTARLFEILDYEPEIQEKAHQEFPNLTGHVSINHLYFQYEDKTKYALEDINLEVTPGETIAILGRVGSGKSTLLRLFVRLLDPTKGELLLDNHPIHGFPLAFLLLAIPLPYVIYYGITAPLQTFAAKCAIVGLKVVGVPAVAQGNMIHLPETSLEVAEACSGIRSLYAFLALGALLAHSMPIPLWGRLLVFASTIPLSVAGNAVRVWGSGLGAYLIGPETTKGTVHELFGLITFSVALGLFVLFRKGARNLWPSVPS